MNESEKNAFFDLFNAWGPYLVSFLLPGGIAALEIKKGFDTEIIVFSVFVVFILLFIYFIKLHSYITAFFYQWRIGKIKGLWSKNGLKKQVKKNFISSSQIRIKVTRGTELVEKDGNNSGTVDIIEELEILKKKSSAENPISIQILLMAPCFKIKHVENRYKTHKGKYTQKKDFLESWGKTLEKLVKYEDEYCNISVRFYYGEHSRWRFYICSDENGDKKIVLLGNYDDNTSGSTTPMYKIVKGEKNIGAFMDKYFEEIWTNSISLEKLIDVINNGKCIRLFCEECKNGKDHTDLCENDCSAAKCSLENDCKKQAAKWNDFLSNLSEIQRRHLVDK